jgi:hypothetical protein
MQHRSQKQKPLGKLATYRGAPSAARACGALPTELIDRDEVNLDGNLRGVNRGTEPRRPAAWNARCTRGNRHG